jgi:hypothetical protein
MKNYADVWKQMFSLVEDLDMDEELTHDILANPEHQLVKTLVYIYSMESFVFREMNKAIMEKNTQKIQVYGPFARALSYIIHCSNQKKEKVQETYTVYRGQNLVHNSDHLYRKYQRGERIRFQGYTSTTLKKELALQFTID